jgi:hypothetical protein
MSFPNDLPDELVLRLPKILPLQGFGSIAQSLEVVEQLRTLRQADPQITRLTQALRSWQAARFRRTYADVLQDAQMGPAALFFLTELYGEQEFGRRDAQFARIAGTVERIFPQSVVQTTTLLAQLHALSESLDACMVQVWISFASDEPMNAPQHAALYQRLWQALLKMPSYQHARATQIQAAHDLGTQLQRHTQVPGLRLMLKMMRGPAMAAGLQDLQRFLECGFDTFGQLGKSRKVPLFLETIATREKAWLAELSS